MPISSRLSTGRSYGDDHRTHKLLLDGDWIETGESVEVRSPYSGDVVGRVAKAGAGETPPRGRRRGARRSSPAARARARGDPRPRRATSCASGTRRWRARSAPRPASRSSTARVEASRAVSTYTFAAVEARKLAGDVVPMDASEAGEGKIAFTLRRPIGVIGAISPFNFPCNLVAHKLAPALAAGCPVVLKPASADAALGAPARRARAGGRPPRRLAQRARRPLRRDRRRAGGGRARAA